MMSVLALCLAFAAGLGPDVTPPAFGAIRPEPDAAFLPERPTLQVVVADVRGSGTRDLVRLVEDGDRGRVVLEVWREASGRWDQVGGDVEVIPALAGDRGGQLVFEGEPVRLLVRSVGAREHVTVVRQPHFPAPGREPLCCLVFADVVVSEDRVELREVGTDPEAVDAVLAIDLDGDGTDELLASRSLPPLGRTAYPSQALVFRWEGGAFGAATLTELPIGSGDNPFVLGETDGRPGEEAAVITTAAQSILYRLALGRGDRIEAERAGLAARAALAVTTDEGPAIAVVSFVDGLGVYRWPAGAPIGEPLGTTPVSRGRLLGPVRIGGSEAILVEAGEGGPIVAYGLPDLALIREPGLAPIDAPEFVPPRPMRAYRGPLFGGDRGGEPAVIVDGVLFSSAPGEPIATVRFAGAHPVGLAGSAGGWMVIAHGLAPGAAADPAGGRMAATPPATGSVSVAPLAVVAGPEPDAGSFEPEVIDAVRLDNDGRLGISATGFRVVIQGPPGSRVHAGVGDGGGGLALHRVPEGRRLEIRLPLPRVLLPYAGDQVLLGVVTPAGATYTSYLHVISLTDPPPLAAATHTTPGSAVVRVEGETAPYATVTVDGQAATVDPAGLFSATVELPPWPTAVEVVAVDPLGNLARSELTGIGLLDYRSLPWIPIAVLAVLAAGIALYLRVPRPIAAARRADEIVLEDLDPDERF